MHTTRYANSWLYSSARGMYLPAHLQLKFCLPHGALRVLQAAGHRRRQPLLQCLSLQAQRFDLARGGAARRAAGTMCRGGSATRRAAAAVRGTSGGAAMCARVGRRIRSAHAASSEGVASGGGVRGGGSGGQGRRVAGPLARRLQRADGS